MAEVDESRVAWVDVLKFLGILAIYIGHFGPSTGKLYSFVFAYHVPLFFLAAGFFASNGYSLPPLAFLKKRAMQLMVPYVFFCCVAMVAFSLQKDWSGSAASKAALEFVMGIRNQIEAGSLWFIPCLFVMVALDYFVHKLFSWKYGRLLVAIILFVVARKMLPHDPATLPSWMWNADNALMYYIFYSIGTVFYPVLMRSPSHLAGRIVYGALVIFSMCFAVIVYFETIEGIKLYIYSRYQLTDVLESVMIFYEVLVALVLIFFNVLLAKKLARVPLLSAMGKNTLAFCGLENVGKVIVIQLLLAVGLKLELGNALVAAFVSLGILGLLHFTVIQFLNIYYPRMVGRDG